MGMTMTQKILAKHAGLDEVKAGQLIEANLDLVLGNDVTAPVAIGEMKIRLNGNEKCYFVSGGFLEISNNVVTVLADEAMPCEMIDLERARKEAEEAKAKLDKLKEDKDILLTEKNLNEALVKVRLAEKLL